MADQKQEMAHHLDVEEAGMRSGHRMELKRAINIRDLQNPKGFHFEIDPNAGWINYDSDSGDEDYLVDSKGRLRKADEDEAEGTPLSDTDVLLNQPILDYDSVEALCEPIHETGFVKKMIVREGKGSIVVPDSKVYIRYVACAEGVIDPFDERRKPIGIFLASEEHVLGLRVGLRTMCVGEIAQFLVHPEFAYGEFGCPPRIPKGARVVFKVEMINFIKKEFFEDIFHMSSDDRAQLPFKEILEAAVKCNKRGNTFYHEKDYPEALKWYSKAIVMLEDYPAANANDNSKRDEVLPNYCCNKAQVLMVLNSYERVCTICKLGLKTAKGDVRAGLLKRFARAKFELHDLKSAKSYCTEAISIYKRANKRSESLQDLRKWIEAKMRQEKADYSDMCKNMFKLK